VLFIAFLQLTFLFFKIIRCHRLQAITCQGFAHLAHRRFFKRKATYYLDYTFFITNMQHNHNLYQSFFRTYLVHISPYTGNVRFAEFFVATVQTITPTSKKDSANCTLPA